MKKSYVKYFSSLLLFGMNGIVASHINLCSYQIVFLRTGIGFAFLLAVFKLSGGRFSFREHPKDFIFVVLSGAAMGACWLFLYEAYARIGVAISALLYDCGSVIVMALSPILFREKLRLRKVLCFLAVLLGVILINGKLTGNGNGLGILCGLLSAVMYALLIILNKKAVHIKGTENPVIQTAASFLVAAVYTFIRSGPSIPLHAEELPWALALGVINTGIGCYLYFSSIGVLPVQTVAICDYLEAVSTVIFSVILLREKLLPVQWLGAILIIGGAVLSQARITYSRPKRKDKF